MIHDTPRTFASDTFPARTVGKRNTLPGISDVELMEAVARLAYESETPAAQEVRHLLARQCAIYGPTTAQLFGNVA